MGGSAYFKSGVGVGNIPQYQIHVTQSLGDIYLYVLVTELSICQKIFIKYVAPVTVFLEITRIFQVLHGYCGRLAMHNTPKTFQIQVD